MIESRERAHETLLDSSVSTRHRHPILVALERLDKVLDRAVCEARVIYGSAAANDPYRGLYIDHDQAQALVARDPGVPIFHANADGLLLEEIGGSLGWLRDTFGLQPFDVALVLVALAAEVDLRYERIYAYLQDDVTRRRPSVELALNLLCSSAEEKLTRRVHVGPEAPLVKQGLLYVVADPNAVQPPLAAHDLKLDDQIIRMLLGQPGLDPHLVPSCELVEPEAHLDELAIEKRTRSALRAVMDEVKATMGPLRLLFNGPRGAGQRKAAEVVARELHAPLLAVDLRVLLVAPDAGRLLTILNREALCHNALLYLEDSGAPSRDDRTTSVQQVLKVMDRHRAVILATEQLRPMGLGEEPLDLVTVTFPKPTFESRRDCWLTHLSSADIPISPNDVDELAGRFRLTPNQIASAVTFARNAAGCRQAARADGQTAPGRTGPTRRELFAAASAQSGSDLAALARRIEPLYDWADIVLPADQHAQLREICSQVRHQHVVYDAWGFGHKLSRGRGVNVLFSGPPGTGKTMAAEVIAGDLQLDLYKIDLSQVVSKYIGETEKNLERIFTAAESANAILFFDEADALFGKRSEVRDSHDRYANLEISYLLQKMEEYEGVAILATNLRQHMDEAFVRRLQIVVEFPFPDEGQRRRIWDVLLPASAPLADDVALDALARDIKLAGGNLRSIAVSAAFYAAADGGRINMAHFLHAARREYQKLGRVWAEDGVSLRVD